MNNYILINRTFAEITPGGCEDSDFSETGFISEREEVSFRELCDLMINHREASQSPEDGNIFVWFSTGFRIDDYATGTYREECIHYHIDNTPNAAKYWEYARNYAKKYAAAKGWYI